MHTLTRDRQPTGLWPLVLWLLFLAAVAIVISMFVPSPAWADATTVDVASTTTVIHPDTALIAFLTGAVMPLLVSLVTDLNARSAVKAVLNLILSIAAGVLSAFVTAGADGLTLYQIGTAGIGAYLSSQVAYTGLWKPTGAIESLSVRSAGVGLK